MGGQVQGERELMAQFDLLRESAPSKAAAAVREAAEATLARSNELVPVDSGELRDSGTVTVEETSTGATATITYSAGYAMQVHEDIAAHHPHGGRAKFLETALREAGPELAEALVERFKAK